MAPHEPRRASVRASFIVLLEFAVGTMAVCLFADWRGRVAASFVKFSAAMVTVAAVVMLLNSLALDPKSAIGGYRLDDGMLTPVKVTAAVFLLTTLPYNWYLLNEDRKMAMITGVASATIGLALVAVVAYYVSLPTWGVRRVVAQHRRGHAFGRARRAGDDVGPLVPW